MRVIKHYHRIENSNFPSEICIQIDEALKAVRVSVGRYSTKEIRESLLHELALRGWSNRVQIDLHCKLTITAMKENIGLCLQTGNMARFYADLLKLQALYLGGNIKVAFYLIPTRSCARTIGSNIAHFERLVLELKEILHEVITVPILVIGFEEDGEL